MSVIKASLHQVGSNVTTDKNIVLTADVSTGDLVISKGVFDGSLTEISRIMNAGGGAQYVPAGTGAVNTTVQAKLRESVSVKDFGGSPSASAATNDAAFAAAFVASNQVYVPAGTYTISQAIQLTGGKSLVGESMAAVIISRTTTTSQTINGVPVQALVYASSRNNSIENLTLTGETTALSGVFFGDINTLFSNSSITNVVIANCFRGFNDYFDLFMVNFDNVNVKSSVSGFNFSSNTFKTSLTFSSCWAENCGSAWSFSRVLYSVLNSCGADYANYTSTGNPYGTGYGSRTSSEGVYTFKDSVMTLNSCGAEDSFGNGVFNLGAGNNRIVFNAPYCSSCQSTFTPNYGSYSTYGVGPINTELGINAITVNSPRFDNWSNTVVVASYPTKPQATVVAFNYDEGTYGVKTWNMVSLSSVAVDSTTTIFAGFGSEVKYCRSEYSKYNNPNIASGIRLLTNRVTNYRTISEALYLSGTGATVTIPIVSQGSANYKHTVRFRIMTTLANGSNPYTATGEFAVASLTSLTNLTSWNLRNVTSVTVSGMNVIITIATSLPTAIIDYDILSENMALVNYSATTLTT